MKTRYGLVSNSSTSSFCIYGCQLDDEWYACNNAEAFVRFLKKLKQEFPADYLEAIYKLKEKYKDNKYHIAEIKVAETIDDIKIVDGPKLLEVEEDDYCDFETFYTIIKHFNLCMFGDDGNGRYIGRSWDSIGDDETGGQFKMRVDEVIKSLFNVECMTHDEAWRDG